MPWVPRTINEARVDPIKAKQVRLLCPHCHGFAYADIPWDATAGQRHDRIKAEIDEHRVVCTGADAIEGRVYQIEYPRA